MGCYQLMTVVTPLVSAQVKLGLEPDSAAVELNQPPPPNQGGAAQTEVATCLLHVVTLTLAGDSGGPGPRAGRPIIRPPHVCVSVCGFRGMSQAEKARFLPLSLSHMDQGRQGGGAFAERAPTWDGVPRLSVETREGAPSLHRLPPGRGKLC